MAAWQELLDACDSVIHTAGPFEEPSALLPLAMQSPRCRVCVDVSDPLVLLETCLDYHEQAKLSNTTYLLAAGAFPGMSNVLAFNKSLPGPFPKLPRWHHF
jgi:saccharopine dehydrogenase-like NADP-dependent oxidoreductase